MTKLSDYLTEANNVLFDFESIIEFEMNTMTYKKKVTLPIFAKDLKEGEGKFKKKIELLRKNNQLPKNLKIISIKGK